MVDDLKNRHFGPKYAQFCQTRASGQCLKLPSRTDASAVAAIERQLCRSSSGHAGAPTVPSICEPEPATTILCAYEQMKSLLT